MDRSRSRVNYDNGAVLVNDILTHHGVKGMKWGVHKAPSSSGSSRISEDSKNASNAARRVQTHGVRVLSNQELQGLITRTNLERQYHSLQFQQKSELDRGLDFTKKALKAGKTVEDVRKFMETPTGKQIKKQIKKHGKTVVDAAKVAAAAYTGGGSAAAAKGAELAIRRIGTVSNR